MHVSACLCVSLSIYEHLFLALSLLLQQALYSKMEVLMNERNLLQAQTADMDISPLQYQWKIGQLIL